MAMQDRSATAIRFPVKLHDELREAAELHGLPVNYLVVKAVEEFLENLLPPQELRLTRTRAERSA
jgi:predicted DNA-binding protein